jgi:hypothetical protein
MVVFRVERNKGYTVMSNHHLRNKELTLKANVIKLRKRLLDAMYEESKSLFANIFVNLSKKVLINQEKCAVVLANSENGPCN